MALGDVFMDPVVSMACLARSSNDLAKSMGDEVTLRFASGLAAARHCFDAPFSLGLSSVEDVRELVARVEGTPKRQQRLVVNGRQLGENMMLGSALEESLGRPPVHEAILDVAIVRISSEWATLLEDISQGDVLLSDLDGEARGNPELVAFALRHDAMSLEFAAEPLRGDRALVLAAVRARGKALQHASWGMRSDREVVLAAMESDWRALAFASSELLADRSFMLAAVRANGGALHYASPELRGDRGLVLAAVQRNGWALSCASKELRGDRECVEAAVNNNPAALDFATDSLKSDFMIMFLAVSAGGRDSSHCG
eukprot:CAMPEP_0117537370 /NCGR_PEP_ID=MMETSP0784-20121206/41928_1 /TAXON_ID=39447 /ORGANISM="" /LENGTH=313 /DNA_ID=CAMNT_0005333951 /DNA_START=74 /DNA_END=1012 /DNA_ORIENTATION=-